MKFNELQLCMAIGKSSPDTPRTSLQRTALAKRVVLHWINLFEESYFPFSIDDIVEWDTRMRKNKDTRTKIAVAKMHGHKCFWIGRGVGECCEEVECGHLIPRCKGGLLGVENCIIECRFHNNGRREMLIEEFLKFNNVGMSQ
jgi:hypothetical protein